MLDLGRGACIFRVMLAKVRQAIREHDLLAPGDAVLVGLSGGPDSVALLHLLTLLRKEYRLILTAVYINHQMRPSAARKEERFCAELCERLGVELVVVREDIPALAKRMKRGLEETAREYRYEMLGLLAEERGCNRVAVGHQADDQAETVLFRVLRGTGRRGLAGIPWKRGVIIRPLLEVRREEVFGYLAEHGLGFCEDRSNRDVRFKRNYLRHKLMPLIRQHVNPQVDRALIGLADTMGEEEAYLEGVIAGMRERAVMETPGGKFELDLQEFRRYDRWIRRRLLRYCLTNASADGAAPDKEIVDRLDRVGSAGRGSLSLPGEVRAVSVDDRLVIGRRVPAFWAELRPGERVRLILPRLDFEVHVSRGGAEAIKAERRALTVQMDEGKVKGPLEVRSIRPGDRFRPLGLGGTKKVSGFLTDRKVAGVYRDEIPAVCDEEGIVWLVGHEIAERVKIDGATRKVLTIECSKKSPRQAETI